MVFAAYQAETGIELWKSDGTPQGTVLLKDFNPGPSTGGAGGFVRVNDKIFFVADDRVHGPELWTTDGTSEGTVLVKDIVPPGVTCCTPRPLTALNGVLLFAGYDGVRGYELWRSDGTANGTTIVKQNCPIYEGIDLVDMGGIVFFHDSTPTHKFWKSNGTAEGTVAVISPGDNSSLTNALGNANGTLFFAGYDQVHGSELWKSDGTPEGTVLLKDIFPGSDNSSIGGSATVGATLFFTADDAFHGGELWKSDGTAEGTVLVKDINSGLVGSGPQLLTAANGTLFLFADDGVHGEELWRSDGTAEGTLLVSDINPGPKGSMGSGVSRALTRIVVSASGILFFTADIGYTGLELWALPLTAPSPAPTSSVAATPQPTPTQPAGVTLSKAAYTCETALASAARKFAAAAYAQLQNCLNGILGKAVTGGSTVKPAEACAKMLAGNGSRSTLTRSRAGVLARIASKCVGVSPSDIDSPCDTGSISMAQVANCILDQHTANVQRMIATEYSHACELLTVAGLEDTFPVVCGNPSLLSFL